jgi:uncharacterized protein (TIGR00255 family)
MTGYGAAEGSLSGGHVAVEIRTVNHRHFSAQLRLPSALAPWEVEIRNRVRERIGRGHVTLTVRWVEEPPEATALTVDLARARAIVDAVSELKKRLDLPGEIDLAFVARQPDVLVPPDARDLALERDELFPVLDAALDALDVMRTREGTALAEELERLLKAIEGETGRVSARAPERLAAERDRLHRSVAELLDGRSLNDERLEQEIAILADKLDVTEELVRLRTHIAACREALGEEGEVGRRLTFLGQEMLREVNTVGSKANDGVIARSVVRLKAELEKLREQVENLE